MADNDQKLRDEFITAFMNITKSEVDDANKFGELSSWDLDTAVASFYAANDGDDDDPMENASEDAPEAAAAAPVAEQSTYTGPRTLGGAPAPEYERPAKKKPAKKTGLATLGSLGGGGSSSHDHPRADSGDSDDDDGRGDLYAGGEKSGLSVQDPKTSQGPSSAKKIVEDMLARARQNLPRQGEDAEQAGPSTSRFHGAGQTLGGEGAESVTIPDPSGPRTAPPVTRFLNIWRNGFSIDQGEGRDLIAGELHSLDDPANREVLRIMTERGQVPLSLMNVEQNQPVDVHVRKIDEDYHVPAGSRNAFSGEGRRLGSPVPGAPSSGGVSIAEAIAPPAASAASGSTSAAAQSTVDESQPVLTIRIQLPDGTRLPARFNTTQTIGDVYSFVQRASPVTQGREWVLATTFPNKEHTDKSVVLGEAAEFKRGGTAVVKWST